jgi:predicted nucleic acid-binding protein
MKAVLDTNILVDYLHGIERAKSEVDRYDKPTISLITWIEILVGAQDKQEESLLRRLLQRFEMLAASSEVAMQAVEIRKRNRIRLPDAIIWATALVHEFLLLTRNTCDFPRDHPDVRVPYQAQDGLCSTGRPHGALSSSRPANGRRLRALQS